MIKLLGSADLGRLVAHLVRNSGESGRDGDIIFRPRDTSEPFDEIAAKERHRIAWARPVCEPYWARTWGLVVDGELRGHADLHGGPLASEQHRATLGIGIERPARRQGHGRRLIETVIEWAHSRGIAWLDLGVFSDNTGAHALYRELGFVETGTMRDRYRVDGHRIDEITMSLALRPAG